MTNCNKKSKLQEILTFLVKQLYPVPLSYPITRISHCPKCYSCTTAYVMWTNAWFSKQLSTWKVVLHWSLTCRLNFFGLKAAGIKSCCLTGLGPGEPWPGTVMALHIPVVGFPGRSIDEAWVQARSYFQVCPWHPTLPDLAPAVWKKTDIPRSTLPTKPHFISLSLPPPSTPFLRFPQKSSRVSAVLVGALWERVEKFGTNFGKLWFTK